MEYLPTLNNIINLDKIPEELDFVKTTISGVLDKIYYKEFYFRKNEDGSEALYSLKLLIVRLAYTEQSSNF